MLCHGYGAPASDLVRLAPELLRAAPRLAEGVRFVFPEAPQSLAELGMPGSRAWFPCPTEALHGAGRLGQVLARGARGAPGPPAAR